MADDVEQEDQHLQRERDQSDLFNAMWHSRKIVFISALLTFLGLSSFIFLSKLAIPTIQTFQYGIQFVFSGADKNQYGNGIPFAASDVIAPAILERVYERNDLKQYGIALNDFISSISIVPYAPSYQAVLNRYNKRLNNKKLTFIERQKIEQEMDETLSLLTGRSAIIRLTQASRFKIPSNFAEKVLHDIPKIWAQFSVEQRGILKTPDFLMNQKLLDPSLIKKQDPMILSQILSVEADNLLNKMTKFGDYPGAHTITTADNISLATLLGQMKRFLSYDLIDLQTNIIWGKHYKNKALLLEIFNQKIKAIDIEKFRYNEKYALFERSFLLYSKKDVVKIAKNASSNSVTPQLSEGFLEKVIDMTKKEEGDKYLRSLSEKKIEAKTHVIQIEMKQQKIKNLISLLNAETNNVHDEKALSMAEVTKKSNQAIHRLNEFSALLGQLSEKLSFKTLSYNGYLFSPLVLGENQKIIKHHPIFNWNVWILIILSTIGIAILTLFSHLAWRMIRSS